MKYKVAVVIPARNEEVNIIPTISSLKKTLSYAGCDYKIVVVDDGSNDKTVEVAKGLGADVVERENRGYSALGRPELADTHNSGFARVEEHYSDVDFVMVSGADTTYNDDYIKLIIEEFETNDNLVMAAGILEGLPTNAKAVRGSGRLIRKSYWNHYGCKLPNIYFSWESHPITWANANGYETKTVYSALMQTPRAPMQLVDWSRYGRAMKENGSLFVYVVLRGLKQLVRGKFKHFFRLIYGYLFMDVEKYPKEMRDFTRNYQKQRIKDFFKKKFS